jgi:hypothetical protein
MSDENQTVPMPYEVNVNDRMVAYRNVSTNGRLFCCMLFVMCMVAWVYHQGNAFFLSALFSALPVGLSCISEQLPIGKLRLWLSLTVYGLPCSVVVFIIIKIFG